MCLFLWNAWLWSNRQSCRWRTITEGNSVGGYRHLKPSHARIQMWFRNRVIVLKVVTRHFLCRTKWKDETASGTKVEKSRRLLNRSMRKSSSTPPMLPKKTSWSIVEKALCSVFYQRQSPHTTCIRILPRLTWPCKAETVAHGLRYYVQNRSCHRTRESESH